MTRLEADEQRDVAAYLDAIGVLYTAVPSGGHMSRGMGARRRAQGAKAGVPDLLIFTAPPRHPQARGVAIEMKRGGLRGVRTGELTADQRRWLADLQAAGWLTQCCYGAREAVRWLRSLGWP